MIPDPRTPECPTLTSTPTRLHLRAVPDTAALVDVPPALVALWGAPWPVRVAAQVWADVITWPHPADRRTRRYQSEGFRLVDLMSALLDAADAAQPGQPRRFTLRRVPAATPTGRARRARLTLTVTGGPDGRPVATVAAAPRRSLLARVRRIHSETVGVVAVAVVMFGGPVLTVLTAGR